MLHLGHMFNRFQDVLCHCHADDTQIYCSAVPYDLNQASSLLITCQPSTINLQTILQMLQPC